MGSDVVNDPPLLRLTGITKRFGSLTANADISLLVERGEILGLLGENGAGKTTLMNIVYGLLQADAGEIEIDGTPTSIKSPRDALSAGVGMVHQHFMLVPNMTVAENVAMGLGRSWFSRSRLDEVSTQIEELSGRFGLELSPTERIQDLSVGVRQRVEIMKLLYRGADLLILDEPTAALTAPEWEHLAAVLRSLIINGKAVILITHKLDELFGVAKRCVVLRDGRVVGETTMADTTKAELAHMMVGREVMLRIDHERRRRGAPVLEVRDLSLVEPDGRRRLSDVDLLVHEHEIMGIAGVDGNGQRELVEALTGMTQPTSGEILIGGERFKRLTPGQFKQASGAVVPEDRHTHGTVLSMSVAENLILKEFGSGRYSRRGWLRRGEIREHASRLVSDYDIRCPDVDAQMSALSGGNQQKAVLARELERNPNLLIAAQPTRGLDVGAMESVYRRLLDFRDRGGGILLISIELDEIFTLADRIAVMVNGRLVRTLDVDEADADAIGLLMAGEDAPTWTDEPMAEMR